MSLLARLTKQVRLEDLRQAWLLANQVRREKRRGGLNDVCTLSEMQLQGEVSFVA